LALAYAREGARLLLCGVEKPYDGIDKDKAICVPDQIFDESRALEALKLVDNKVDIYVHAAKSLKETTLEACTDEIWQKELDENVKTAFVTTRVVGPAMVRAGIKGKVLYISTIHKEKPNAKYPLWSISAGAIGMLMADASLEFGRFGINCNLIEAGPMAGDDQVFDNPVSGIYYNLDIKVPRGSAGAAEEIVKPALFLTSDDASYINGASLRVDGGFIGTYGPKDKEKRWAVVNT